MAYKIKAFNISTDKDSLSALWLEKSEKNLEKRFEYMYGNAALCHVKTSLLFDDKSPNTIGCLSLFTHTIRLNNSQYKLGINCDMFVRKEHRLLGPAVILLKSLVTDAQQNGYHALLAMPNKMSAPVFQRVGYTHIGEVSRRVRIIDSKDKMAGKIKNKFILNIASKTADLLLGLFSLEWLYRALYFARGSSSIIKEIKFNEINFDDNLKASGSINKTPEYLEWRYHGISNNGSKAFALVKNGLTAGLIVYHSAQNDVIVQDVLIPASSVEAKVMLSAFIHKMRSEKMKSISVLSLGMGKANKLLKSFGFLLREGRGLYARYLDSKFADNFIDIHRLDLFEGDLDL